MPLAEIQETLKTALLNTPEQNRPKALHDLFIEDDIPVQDRLNVYSNNVMGSISDYMLETFPLLKALVGEDFLKTTIQAFIREHPPSSGCLHHYGSGFDAFIRDFAPAKSIPYLADVAKLELYINAAYYAPDDEALEAQSLTDIVQETLTDTNLGLRKSAHLIGSEYPLHDLRHYCLSPQETPLPDMTVPSKILVIRPALSVQIVPLAEDDYIMLNHIQRGHTLGQALEATLEASPNFNVAAFLQKHIALKSFCR